MLLQKLLLNEVLGASGFYPLKSWARRALSVFSPSTQLAMCAKLYAGADLSQIAPNELGCAESVTRLVNTLFAGSVSLTTGTSTLYSDLVHNRHWKRVYSPVEGCMILAVTGQGRDPKAHGHVGIVSGPLVYSNKSETGQWDKHLSVAYFTYMFMKQGFPIHYFVIQNV